MGKYEDDVAIDSDNLDHEWESQPLLYEDYSGMLAEAQRDRDNVKDELDTLKANVELDYRSGRRKRYDPDTGKPLPVKETEGVIRSLVESDEEVIAKVQELVEAKYRVNQLDGAVEAFSHRKKALERLVDLIIFGYHGEPKSGRSDSIRELKKRKQEGVNEGNEG